MAVTFTPARVAGGDTVFGNKKRRVRDITCSGTYTTGGDTIDPVALFGLRVMDEFNVHNVPSDGTLGYPATYVYTTGKLKFWETGAANAGSAEKGNGESMASVTFRVTAYGR